MFSNQHSVARRTPADVVAAIRARCTITEKGCWEYPCGNDRGYASVTYRRKRWMVHRFMYWHVVGEFDLSLEILHRCDNPPCCNPDHLTPGTHHENLVDCLEKGRHGQSSKTHCKRGHPLSGDNLWIKTDGARECKACVRGRQRLRAGWPIDLAFSVEKQPLGFRPNGIAIDWQRARAKGTGRRLKTICVHGHPLVGDNLYITSEGRRRCRQCHYRHVSNAGKKRSAHSIGRELT